MATLHADLDSAITSVLSAASDQTVEFKERLRKLIENATEGYVPDTDTRDVIELASVDESFED